MPAPLYLVRSDNRVTEVHDYAEAVRATAQPDHCPRPYMAGISWWAVRAHSEPEAVAAARQLRDGRHPDQHDVEHAHALIRGGLMPE